MELKEYSLWYVPAEPHLTKYSGLITKFAQENNTPIFIPHMTNTGGITEQDESLILGKAGKLAKDTPVFTADLEEVVLEDFYYRAVIAVARKDPLLFELYKKARLEFGLPLADYYGHVSFAYGDLSPVAKRRIKGELDPIFPETVRFDKLSVVKAFGEADQWQILESFNLRAA